MNCLRFLDFTDFKEIDRLTIPEYQLRMKAFRLNQVDELHKIHQLAWAINMAKQRKKNGRPVYRRFEQFFNFKKAEKIAKGGFVQSSIDKFKSFIANFNSEKGG